MVMNISFTSSIILYGEKYHYTAQFDKSLWNSIICMEF